LLPEGDLGGNQMKRIFGAVLAAMSLAALSACQPPPPPLPADYQPPVIESVEVSPRPAAPGDVVTITMAVSDDEVVSSVNLGMVTVPSGAELPPLPRICSSAMDQGEDRTRAVITITCEVPTFASNGTWQLPVHIIDGTNGGYSKPGVRTTATFDVAGGSDDSSGPTLTSYTTDPAVLRQDTVFILTMLVADESQPVLVHSGAYGDSLFFRKPFAANSTVLCREPVHTPVSATEVEVSWTCRATPGVTEFGQHRTTATARDALGHARTFDLQVDIT
jgi:hypothetical protein